jgi:peptidoglycan/LPS O-acetylase OafA/YrhL
MIAWSVCMEEQFYVVWGAIVSRVPRLSTLGLIVLTLLPGTLLIRMAVFSVAKTYSAFYYNTFAHLDSLLVGVGIALLMHAGKLRPEKLERFGPLLCGLPVLGFFALVIGIPSLAYNHVSMVYAMSVIAILSGMLLLGTLSWKPAIRLFSHPWLAGPGRKTYGMYLLHPLANDLAKLLTITVFGASLYTMILPSWIFIAVTALLITWLLATLSWHLLEARFLRLRKHFTHVPSGFG